MNSAWIHLICQEKIFKWNEKKKLYTMPSNKDTAETMVRKITH